MDYSAFHWSEKARKYAETIGTIFNVKGRVNTVQDLPSTGNKVGDLWLVGLTTDTDLTEYAWLSFDNVTRWEKLGSTATSLAFSALTGSPNDNVALKNALDGKYSTSNPNGYISGITSAMVTTALGYTPYNSSNPSGYISGITSAMVTTALGYTPQQQLVSGTNIKTINGNSLLGSGNLALSSFKLFHHDWFDYQLNDMAWLRADTFSWQDGTVYSDAYNHLVADYNGGTSQTETVGSYTITYVLATDGHKITTDETNVANIYNESGVAWYYILDTTNQRFKLPRENPAREELIQVIRAKGNGNLLGITKGKAPISGQPGIWDNGNNLGCSAGPTSSIYLGVTSDSTKSGIISSMTDSTSVYKGKQYLYFYVGQYNQSATEQTAGLNSELFNGKVDLDGSNATFPHIIETYTNGTSWYRIWSDGWCEQGGNSQTDRTIYLLKPFANTNYNVHITTTWTTQTGAVTYSPVVSVKQTGSFYCGNYNSQQSDWSACGYVS